jgi:hypothetical protein
LAGQRVRVWLHSVPVLLGEFTVDASGRVVATIPVDALLGEHRMVVQAVDGSLVGWDSITLAASADSPTTTASASGPATSGASGSLPVTGGAPAGLAVLALVLVLVGAVTASSARRRAIRYGRPV